MAIEIDAWAEQWGVKRSEAIRRLLKAALEAEPKSTSHCMTLFEPADLIGNTPV